MNNFNQVCPSGNHMVDAVEDKHPPCNFCGRCEWCLNNMPDYDDKGDNE